MVNVTSDPTVEIFEHLDITYKLYIYIRIKDTNIIMTGSDLNKYHAVL